MKWWNRVATVCVCMGRKECTVDIWVYYCTVYFCTLCKQTENEVRLGSSSRTRTWGDIYCFLFQNEICWFTRQLYLFIFIFCCIFVPMIIMKWYSRMFSLINTEDLQFDTCYSICDYLHYTCWKYFLYIVQDHRQRTRHTLILLCVILPQCLTFLCQMAVLYQYSVYIIMAVWNC